MDDRALLALLREHYSINAQHLELLREAGSTSYAVFTDGEKYFLRLIHTEIMQTAAQGIDIHLYLQRCGYAVPKVIFTREGAGFVKCDKRMLVLYEFIDGDEPDVDEDIEGVGALVGQLHGLMAAYPGALTAQDKWFFIDRYIQLLEKKGYPKEKRNLYRRHGDALWERVRHLPRGYAHGDLYSGNIHKSGDGKLYMLDFDTSAIAFPAYDIALFCRATDYFDFNEDGYEKTHDRAQRFAKAYRLHHPMDDQSLRAIDDFLAIYHYQLQATILELHGLNCVDFDFIDAQYDWLMKWAAQCADH